VGGGPDGRGPPIGHKGEGEPKWARRKEAGRLAGLRGEKEKRKGRGRGSWAGAGLGRRERGKRFCIFGNVSKPIKFKFEFREFKFKSTTTTKIMQKSA